MNGQIELMDGVCLFLEYAYIDPLIHFSLDRKEHFWRHITTGSVLILIALSSATTRTLIVNNNEVLQCIRVCVGDEAGSSCQIKRLA